MRQLAYAVAEEHGRLHEPGDRVDLLARSGRAALSLIKLNQATNMFLLRTVAFTAIDALTAGATAAKGKEVADKAAPHIPDWLGKALDVNSTEIKRYAKGVAVLMVVRSAVRSIVADTKGRAKWVAAAQQFKEDGLAAAGLYRVRPAPVSQDYPEGLFMGMPVGTAHTQPVRVVTPFG